MKYITILTIFILTFLVWCTPSQAEYENILDGMTTIKNDPVYSTITSLKNVLMDEGVLGEEIIGKIDDDNDFMISVQSKGLLRYSGCETVRVFLKKDELTYSFTYYDNDDLPIGFVTLQKESYKSEVTFQIWLFGPQTLLEEKYDKNNVLISRIIYKNEKKYKITSTKENSLKVEYLESFNNPPYGDIPFSSMPDETFDFDVRFKDRISDKVIIAVIDSGFDYNHPSLNKRILPSNAGGTGWDFISQDPNPDASSPFPLIAGLIPEFLQMEHGTGMAGGCVKGSQNLYVLPIKVLFGIENLNEYSRFAHDHGAKIVNMSFGSANISQNQYQSMKKAIETYHDLLFVAAAGNDISETESGYPAQFSQDHKNVISVGCWNEKNNTLCGAYGDMVDVYAPSSFLTTVPGRKQDGSGRFSNGSGSSSATSYVSNLAGKLLLLQPSLTPQNLKEIIISSAKQDSIQVEDNGPTVDVKIANLENAISYLLEHESQFQRH